MNYQNITFIYSKTAYFLFIQKKLNTLTLNENDFFLNFITKIENINFEEITNIWDSLFCNDLLTKAQVVCEYESLTFLPDESKEEYQYAQNNLLLISEKVFANNTFTNESEKNLFIKNWRIFISIYVTFTEWCHDVNFYCFQKSEQLRLLRESPLISLNQL